jgi:hypothetical protein
MRLFVILQPKENANHKYLTHSPLGEFPPWTQNQNEASFFYTREGAQTILEMIKERQDGEYQVLYV